MFRKLIITALSMSALGLGLAGPVLAQSDAEKLVVDVPANGTRIEIDEDQDEVYDAVREGKIQPFSALYAAIGAQLNGRVIKVELEEDDDEWIYELKLMHENSVIRAEYNAATLELMELRGRNLNSVIKK
ncbi:PepSY domain-containing protein [Vibrio tapetis]|uniref:PepSY domain-containing protein n=1 Tax=Vibrio tapetis subsp. tapetis TaxID=1671868 RepID=A0A2N8ZAG3_9VIBR|nr:hypothetical protein [Vibrio tapetis]SON48877.1 conserved exported protein of unknown function [Vibrio tapetis subsp. tapetis]